MPTNSFTPLTPLAFLERAADVFPDKTAVVMDDRRVSYRDFAAEANRLARALQVFGVAAGDRVACLCPNIPELLAAHFAVPLAGAVIVAINSRLSPEEIRYILDHSGAVLLIVDGELQARVAPELGLVPAVVVVVVVAEAVPRVGSEVVPHVDYADFLARGSDEPLPGPSPTSWRRSRSTTPRAPRESRRG